MFKFILFYYGKDHVQTAPLLHQVQNYCKYPVQYIDVQYSARKSSFTVTQVNSQSYMYLPPDLTDFPCLVVYRGLQGSQGTIQKPYTYHLGRDIFAQLQISPPGDDVIESAMAEASSRSMQPRWDELDDGTGQGRSKVGAAGIASSTSRFASSHRMTEDEMQKYLEAYRNERREVGACADVGVEEGPTETQLMRRMRESSNLTSSEPSIGSTSSLTGGKNVGSGGFSGSTSLAGLVSRRPVPPPLPTGFGK